MAVGRVYAVAVAAAARADPRIGAEAVVIPVVAECDDSWLSAAVPVQVDAADAGAGLDDALANRGAGAAVAQGAVGAGTGTVCFDWKGGIGTSSRVVPEAGATVGALVLANFGAWSELRIDGVPVGSALGPPPAARSGSAPPAGSCIAVVATDAPLTPPQLERLARRAGLGLARAGSVAHHGSGEIFVAFATSGERSFADRELNPLFQAAVDATEEAVLCSLWAAVDTEGREGRLVRALPREKVLELYRGRGR
jgi:D-aminopeptidase